MKPFINLGLSTIMEKSTTEQEIEHVFYVQVSNYDEIKKLAHSKVVMEQWEIRSSNKNNSKVNGAIRIRSIDNKEFILTTKLYTDDGMGAKEMNVDVAKDMFEAFKILCPVGTKKTRYSIKDGRHTWEIDVYTNQFGEEVRWCKVDLEVPNVNTLIPDKFPFKVIQSISKERTDEQQKFIEDLFIKEFNMYNMVNILPLEGGGGL